MSTNQSNSNFKYENVFKGNMGALYARIYDTKTKKTQTKSIRVIPSIYVNAKNEAEATDFISIPEKRPLKKLTFKTMKDYRETFNLYKNSNVPMYGNKSQEQTFIRENWKNPIDSYHEFGNMWFWDIETAIFDESVPKKVSKDDWKPTGHARAAMATITSIQIYDTEMKMFFIFALKKDWDNVLNFKSPHGPVKYIKCETEEKMLKKFLELLRKRDPALMSGWNTAGYDDPYVTNRIIRVLDKRDDLYYYDDLKKMWKFNTDCLSGEYVKQLSPHANLIRHREVQTNYGIQDEFKWIGIIQEDYLDLYKKYTYTIHTSYSLDTIAGYELGSEKINHDEHTDFKDFYENNFNTFIEYGIQDVGLLIELNEKLKLIDLAKFISYTCGVTMDDIRGTIKQWNSYMYNNHLNKKQVLPLEGKFGKIDKVIMEHAITMPELDENKKHFFSELLSDPDTHGQTFPGGITRGTAKFWKEVFSLDFGSLYPSAIQWANIGIETLIQPEDLPIELLNIRAKYAIFYPKNVEPKDLIKFDFAFANNVLGNPTIAKEIEDTLKKYNVCMTPNGMFFRLDERSVLSQTMEDIIVQRKVHKKNMKAKFKEIQDYKNQDFYDKIKLKELEADADMFNVYQMGLKILVNSAYGALSMQATVFAGDKEYFSGAVTSSSRIANLIAGQANSKKIDEIAGVESKEIQYEEKSYQDNIPQIDTDSNYISVAPIVQKKFGKDYRDTTPRARITEFIDNYIQKVSLPLTYAQLDIYSNMMNAYLPEKLVEDPEVICDNFISIAPKMYMARKWWDEGLTLTKPKMKVTGLSMVRASTPKFFRKELESAMSILIDGDVEKVIEYMKEVRIKTDEQKPSQICINQGVSSLDYEWQESTKKFKKWVPDKKKWLSAPVNSRASLVHNKYINDKGLNEIKDIEPGNKIGFLYMKEPNITLSNAFAFNNEKVFDYGLNDYIDRELMYIKGFENNIKLITTPIGWDLTPQEDLINEDEW